MKELKNERFKDNKIEGTIEPGNREFPKCRAGFNRLFVRINSHLHWTDTMDKLQGIAAV